MVGFREQQRSEYYNGGFVSLRDNDGMARSVSVNERKFVVEECVGKGLRMDGREAMEYRPIRLSSLNRRFCESECQVSFGASTKVHCTVRCELVPPANSMVRPNEGMLNFRVDCSPMACLSWESMAPVSTESASYSNNNNNNNNNSNGEEDQKWWSNRIIRTLEGLIKQGGAIDVEALCVSSGHWVWNLIVHVVILDAGGNLIDASILAAMAALRHFRLPVVETNDQVPKVWAFHDREPIPLPLHHTPFSCTFALFDLGGGVVAAMVDPNEREEYLRYGTLTVSYHVVSDGTVAELCGLDFGGGCELSQRQISSCIDLARTQCCQLSSLLEQSLSTADQVAQQSLLQQVLSNQNNNNNSNYKLSNSETPSFLDTDTSQEIQDDNDQDNDEDGEQERYRIQALEYSSLHQAAKVKENNNEEKNKSTNMSSSNSLMAAMLHSASIISSTSFKDEDTKEDNVDALLTTEMDENKNPVEVKQNNNSLMSSVAANTEKPAKFLQPTSKIKILQPKQEQDKYKHFKGEAINQQQIMDGSNNGHIQEAMPKHDSNIMDFTVIDSDEEEVTRTLKSEFQTTPKPELESNKTKSHDIEKPVSACHDHNAEDDEVDNLAMAVVTKKKKKTKSKKKK